ncbi:MAG: lytic transglycosylase domain-containing protein [Oscillospiraceae bacterium]|jgi:soluble lytic murein transglycosylase|nr:lytic transglycosylase domain-containing protein [Oscillospiraceae bacterium]
MGVLLYLGIMGAGQLLYPLQYKELAESYAAAYDLEPELFYAVIKCESNFDPRALSDAGAMGLTQLTPETFTWVQTKTGETLPNEALWVPEVALRYGAYLLDMHYKEFGNTRTVLAAYHAGRGRTGQWLEEQGLTKGDTVGDIPYADTDGYVSRVTRTAKAYRFFYPRFRTRSTANRYVF